jgi:hypothetical protein
VIARLQEAAKRLFGGARFPLAWGLISSTDPAHAWASFSQGLPEKRTTKRFAATQQSIY